MRNLKRALSLALASVMLLGMMVVGTSAAYSDVTSAHNVEAIEVMKAAEVMIGDDQGNFNPDKVVTRAEMAVVVCKLLYGQDLSVASFADVATYSDVPAWAQGYVNLCSNLGIVAGVGGGKFDPNATVTTAQAALMLLRALEVEVEINEYTDYKVAAMTAAEDADLFEGLGILAANAGLTRNNVAQMALNAMKYNDSETVYLVTDGTKSYEIDELKDALLYAALMGDGFEVFETKDYSGSLIDEVFEISVTDSKEDAYGRPATSYDHEDWKASLIFADKADYAFVVDADTTLKELVKDQKLEKKITDLSDKDEEVLPVGSQVELFVNDDKVLTKLVVFNYSLVEIEEIDECNEKKHENAIEDGAEYVIELSNGAKVYDINFPAFDAETYVEGAKLVMTGEKNVYDFENIEEDFIYADCAIADEFEGKASTIGTGYIRVDGVKYITSSTCAAISKGDEGTFYTDPNGFVIGFEEVEEKAANIDDVVYTLANFKKEEKNDYGKVTTTCYVQVMTLAGEVENLVVAIDNASGDDYGTLEGINPHTLYTVDTYSAKKVINGVNYKGCSKLTAWNGDDDYTVGTIAAGEELKTSSTRVDANIDTKNYVRLNSKTTYIMVDGELDDVEVDVNVGGVNSTLAAEATVIATKTSSNFVASVVLLPGSEVDTAVDYDNVIYVDGTTEEWEETIVGDDEKECVSFAIYEDNGELTEHADWITIEGDRDSIPASGFYTYSIDEDGIYELEAVEDLELTENYDDEAGIVYGAFESIYEDLMTLDTKYLVDIDVADAVVINLTDAEVDTVDEISEFEGTVKMAIYVNEGAQIIVVTEAVEA